jgi:hypothetical protein
MLKLDDLPAELIDIVADIIQDEEQGDLPELIRSWTEPICTYQAIGCKATTSTRFFICNGSTLIRLSSVCRNFRNVIFESRFVRKALIRDSSISKLAHHNEALKNRIT